MNNINTEPIEEVLKYYPFEVKAIKNDSYKGKKGVWWIQTSSGTKILKKISNSEATLKFIISAVNYLISRGVHIPPLIKTKDGMEYANYNGVCFVVSEAIDGRVPSYDNSKDLEAMVKTLAAFHKNSEGFKPSEGTKPKNHLGTWPSEYDYQLNDMHKFYMQELEKSNDDKIGTLVRNNFPYFYDRGVKAIEGLKKGEYAAWVSKVEALGGLCHQDFAAGNLIIDSSKFYILDTDSLTLEIPARDIRKLLNKIMKKKEKWDLNIVAKILSCYQTVNPLSFEEWQVVKYDLMFPHLFLGSMNKFYYQRDKEWSLDTYSKKIKDIYSFEKTADTLLNNFNTIVDKVINK